MEIIFKNAGEPWRQEIKNNLKILTEMMKAVYEFQDV